MKKKRSEEAPSRISASLIISIAIVVLSLTAMAVYIYFWVLPSPVPPKYQNVEKAVMPSLVGMDYFAAKTAYQDMINISVEREEYSQDYPAEAIISQSLDEGRDYIVGVSQIQVIVSRGADPEREETSSSGTYSQILTLTDDASSSEEISENGSLTGASGIPDIGFESFQPADPLEITSTGADVSAGSEIIAELNGLMAEYGPDAGFCYVELNTGISLEYNADERFSAGSVIKAPYINALLLERGDLSESFEMTEETLNSPSELISGKPVGTFFTLGELAWAALANSDNTAYKMIYTYAGYEFFNRMSEELGIPHRMTDENYWFRLSARQSAIYFKNIYYFIEHNKNGKFMLECMSAASSELIAAAPPGRVRAGKYGYLPQDDFYTYGECAIVYGDNPYILCLYVRGAGTDIDSGFIERTAELIEEFNLNNIFSTPAETE